MKVINFRMTMDDERRLDKVCEHTGLTQAQVLRDMLAFFTGEHDARVERQRQDMVAILHREQMQFIEPQEDPVMV